jgi:5'-nucleotidase
MHANPSQRLAIGISARGLFELDSGEQILREHGKAAYRRHQLEQGDQTLPAGPGLPVLKALMRGAQPANRGIDLVVLSECAAEFSLPVISSARQESLEVDRAAFTGGESLVPYLQAFGVDLFLSADQDEVAQAMTAGTAAALVCSDPQETEIPAVVRIAVGGDAVALASEMEDAEDVTKPPAPRWIRALATLQQLGNSEENPILTALVCCEESTARERILRSLSEWEIDLDRAFFTDSAAKAALLDTYCPHIVFDASLRSRPAAQLHEVGGSKLDAPRSRFRRRA